MKKFIILLALMGYTLYGQAQSIVGRWQLVKQSSCVDDEMATDDDTQALVDDMKSLSGAAPQVLEFRDNNTGQESTKIISKKKPHTCSSFIFAFCFDIAIFFQCISCF